jgi:hypothetical protein
MTWTILGLVPLKGSSWAHCARAPVPIVDLVHSKILPITIVNGDDVNDDAWARWRTPWRGGSRLGGPSGIRLFLHGNRAVADAADAIPGLRYVGDTIMSVLVADHGNVYAVLVRLDNDR